MARPTKADPQRETRLASGIEERARIAMPQAVALSGSRLDERGTGSVGKEAKMDAMIMPVSSDDDRSIISVSSQDAT